MKGEEGILWSNLSSYVCRANLPEKSGDFILASLLTALEQKLSLSDFQTELSERMAKQQLPFLKHGQGIALEKDWSFN